MQVTVGDSYVGGNEGYEQEFNVAQIIMHPDYDSRNRMDHDIALLKLDGQIRYSDRVSPICLASNNVEDWYTCTVTGWGDTLGI